MPRASVAVAELASEAITTIENAPMAIDRTVRAERNLCAPMTVQPMRRNSKRIMRAGAKLEVGFLGGRGLHRHHGPLADAGGDLHLAIVAGAELHLVAGVVALAVGALLR